MTLQMQQAVPLSENGVLDLPLRERSVWDLLLSERSVSNLLVKSVPGGVSGCE